MNALPTPSGKNILLISPEPWSHIFVSKHHYAIELSRRGHSVFFLNPASAGPLRLSAAEGYPGITIVDYPGQLRGLRLLPAPLRILLNKRFLRKLERQAGIHFDVVWNFENSRFSDLQFAGDRFCIYHQVDLNQTFNLGAAASSADVCFCTTDLIREQILPYNKNVYKIHHGTAPDALQHRFTTWQPRAGALTAIYIGNLDMEFMDRDLLRELVRSYPQVRFQLIGPYREDGATYQQLRGFPNVEWIGKRPARDIPGFLDAADMLLVLYAAPYHRDQASPHKFMEYFASGRVVVATYTDEYKDKRHLLAMGDAQEEYVPLFGRVAADIASYNTAGLQAARRAFAEQNAYSLQVDAISNYCQQSNFALSNG